MKTQSSSKRVETAIAHLKKSASGGKQFPTMVVPKSNKKTNRSNKDSIAVAKHAKVLEEYRAFLIHDCGQMTIEGIRADMDTAQRRFDLERLFVPLKVLPTPPEIPASDPEREQNLLKWQAENKDPLPFGPIFRNHKHLALLALPGGGKTLLLKRLAVAYADPTRRKSSNDDLPAFDILPILIRCREWKEHIRRPIPVLLKHIAEITGKTTLADLDDALVPLLKKGRVLLLVDGLDEIHNDADRSTFVEHLEAFLDEYKLIRLVVTSREAGFSLVAPSIARFCERWRVASLEPDAVRALCSHWHRLMTGDSPESFAEANDVAERLLGNDSLRHLAENPLLLTMLLVVKHGAGRLPPDRVSLYGRAVEVLLDTWNIKGHEPLNLKEAVPQLACVAFELMRKGKQTATEKELLILLEEARERVPQIRRYAKDTPSAFLKRVELRSSLLVEAGHQLEATRAVSFYQFRHLTFQEYLAAVAAVDGHYMEYQKDDTVTTPLTPYLTTEEWKDVIPMAAVLARKQAEPLIAALVDEGNSLRQRVEQGKESVGRRERINYPHKLPSAIARIVQCLIEEADAAPETLIAALQLVALFARSCWSSDNWQALSRGPYGEELLHQTWLLYAPMKWPIEFLVRNTFARLAWFRKPLAHWESADGQNELMHLLQSRNYEEIVRGLLIPPAVLWGQSKAGRDWVPILADIEAHLFNDDRALWGAAAWAWGRIRNVQKLPLPSHAVLDRLLSLCLVDDGQGIAAYALVQVAGLPRHAWTPVLTGQQRDFYRQVADNNSGGPDESPEYDERRAYELAASLMVGFHSWDLWPEKELAKRLRMFGKGQFAASIKAMLEQINLVIEKKHPLKKRRTKS